MDLRPAPKHRRVGLGEGRGWRLVGTMRECFDEDRLADRAVAEVVRQALFRLETREEFMVERVMDTMGDFLAWLEEFGQRRIVSSHAWLIRRLERALLRRQSRIVTRGPLMLRRLTKIRGRKGADR